ncbi:hypothetical protein BGW36DRAFT_367621 [Talaromyces proteolyticus]|uniref:Uncharacterized protein n=1 Tax=Talaromyces proteolyticus TaxID=1131652 RepID=A0AAD4Q6B1_9EURO|nr:uncharacterized protein BGW36DRAFT_367621 [Talaromyces proteolyticus]KAH8705463.1 hypothetical protein BGW36DRAFT_367621 [Talaromyces proteolyticus]
MESASISTMPAYFELSWSILSSIGLFSVALSALVIAATSLTPLSIVPPILSAACAVANGLCYYAFYTNYNPDGRAVAAAFADFFWLIQEAGLSFYSYQILLRTLQGRRLVVFQAIFWTMIAVITCIRVAIIVSRVHVVLHGSNSLQYRIDYLHMGYFICIAVVESCSSAFLIQLLLRAYTLASSVDQPMHEGGARRGIFRHLLKTTEMRMATLAIVGITRAVTYSFQTTSQSATTVVSQLDRFVYSLECLFPFVMLVDILASKAYHQRGSSARSHLRSRNPSFHSRRCRCSYRRLDSTCRCQEMPEVARRPLSQNIDVEDSIHGFDSSWFPTPPLKQSDSTSFGKSHHDEWPSRSKQLTY